MPTFRQSKSGGEAPPRTWEGAVAWLRRQTDQAALVRACYYDDPLLEAAKRFADSDEWKAVAAYLPRPPLRALDLGAGRGIASYALARMGWRTVALEPDGSALVGAQAVRRLAQTSRLPIRVVRGRAQRLPFHDASFDLVYGRQVLHHARDLRALCRESARVLKPGGRLVATREHVISRPEDLAAFLETHPLHKFYGGEHAYRLAEYRTAIEGAGLRFVRVLGPMDSVINYFPMTRAAWSHACRRPLARVLGRRLADRVAGENHGLGRWILRTVAAHLSRASQTPGRLYSFIAEREKVADAFAFRTTQKASGSVPHPWR